MSSWQHAIGHDFHHDRRHLRGRHGGYGRRGLQLAHHGARQALFHGLEQLLQGDGFSRKASAPILVASTAVSMVAWPLIMMTGMSACRWWTTP
jgi:hypothetical protein